MGAHVGLRREDVISAAAAVADESGFEAVTMSAVARRLAVRAQTVHAHIGSIQDLQREVQLRGVQLLREQLHAQLLGLTGGAALVELAVTVAAFEEAHPGLSTARSRPVAGDDHELLAAVQEVHLMPRRFLAAYDLGEADATHYSRLIWSLLYGFLTMRRGAHFSSATSTDVTLRRGIEAIVRDLEWCSSQGTAARAAASTRRRAAVRPAR